MTLDQKITFPRPVEVTLSVMVTIAARLAALNFLSWTCKTRHQAAMQ